MAPGGLKTALGWKRRSPGIRPRLAGASVKVTESGCEKPQSSSRIHQELT